VLNDTTADSTPFATETSGMEVSKEPLEQLRNGFPKRFGGFSISREGQNTNEGHENKAQPHDAEERTNGTF